MKKRMLTAVAGVLRSSLVVVSSLALFAPAAPAEAAFPGVNGKIAFTSDRDGDFDIYLMNPDGTGVVQLTNSPGFDIGPAWSADGTRIVFSSERDGFFAGPFAPASKIYVMSANGSGQTRLTSGTTLDVSPSWSPDGTRIVFSRAELTCRPAPGGGEVCEFPYKLHVMSSAGADLTQITNNSGQNLGAVWSPGGERIAFESRRPDLLQPGVTNSDVYSINPEGTAEARLTTNPAVDEAPDWSPDGGRIAFDRALSDIWAMNADGGQQAQLLTNGITPAWSPDGQEMVFVVRGTRDDEINVAPVDGSGRTNISNNPAFDNSPDWAPLVNAPPRCDGVRATPDTLSPPNHKLVPVRLSGATDPDGDTVTLTITGVTQDEPPRGQSDNTSPDAASGASPNQVNVRSERSPHGDGRVYRIAFRVSDGVAECAGAAIVGVPKHKGAPAADSAPPSYNSFGS